MPWLYRATAIAVALLVLVGVGVLALRAGGVPIGLGDTSPSRAPSPGAKPSARPSSTATRTPAATPEPDQAAVFTEIEEQVRDIRGLPAPETLSVDVISRSELADELLTIFDEEYPPEERQADNIALRAMGLLEPDQDVAELQLQLLGEGVQGFYDDTEKRMVVVSQDRIDAQARITYAHEYDHALQDASGWNIDTLEINADGEDDRGLARLSLVEGDATLLELVWAVGGGLTQEELAEVFAAPPPDTTGIPEWMVSTLLFPYTSGLEWTLEVAGGDPFSPDFSAIDEAFVSPPDSTEQVMHFEKWESREAPVSVVVADIATALGAGWEQVESTPNGEAFIGFTLEHFGVQAATAREAAAGWGGDRMVVATGPSDAFALAWILAWDTPQDAEEFTAAYQAAIESLPFPAELVPLSPDRQLIIHASSAELLAATRSAAGGG